MGVPKPGEPLNSLSFETLPGARVVKQDNDVVSVATAGLGSIRLDVDFKTGRIAFRFTRYDALEVGDAKCDNLTTDQSAGADNEPT